MIWVGGIWTVAIVMLLSPILLLKQWNFYLGVAVLTGLACLYVFFRVMRWRRDGLNAGRRPAQ